jgi:hypothetical protein
MWDCNDCGVNVSEIGEYYMLLEPVWFEANNRYEGMLCIGCVEKRLGRELTKADFWPCPLNEVKPSHQSERLVNRLTS